MNTKVIWLTGLSGVGKSTLAKRLYIKLKKKSKIKIIDGDDFRKKTQNIKKFDKKNIIINNLKIIKYVKKFLKKYQFIIVSAISPILKTRKIAKKNFGSNYFEIYLYCKIQTLEKRDTKGLYYKAKKKIIKNLIGYNSDIKYEKSDYKKISINTDKYNI